MGWVERRQFLGFADFFGSSRICGKRRVYGNQTILVWHASASKRRHIPDMEPELEALVTFIAPHKSAMKHFFFQMQLEGTRLKQPASETRHENPLNPTYACSPKSVVIRMDKKAAGKKRPFPAAARNPNPNQKNLLVRMSQCGLGCGQPGHRHPEG